MSCLRINQLVTHHVGPIDLQVEAAECVCIEGASGSGKTLLLRAIADLDPHQGTVSANGVLSTAVPAPQWRRTVALVVSESQWWGERIRDHFDDGVDESWLERLDLPDEAMDWDVARCSTGERQRLALLRVLMQRPPVLLLDEPTGNLDEENTRRVEALLDEYRRKQQAALLWVSHDSGQVRRVAQRAMILGEGRLTEKRPT